MKSLRRKEFGIIVSVGCIKWRYKAKNSCLRLSEISRGRLTLQIYGNTKKASAVLKI